MTDNTTRTALVTGANSGLGFEAAAQLAETGFGKVIVTARTVEKTGAARRELEARTGREIFDELTLDNDDLATAEAAAATLAERGEKLDLLLLNAGIVPPKEATITADGIEATVAATLVGHHVLTVRLLERDLLGDHARIVIAGSEATRGDVPTFNPVDMGRFASEHFGGNLEGAIEAQMRMRPPAKYKTGSVYATAKLFVAWWAAHLAPMLPAGTTVNVVSPGSTPETNAARNAPFYMRKIMLPLMKLLPGKSHTVSDGAARYLEVADYGDEINGEFFASAPKQLTGPLVMVDMPRFEDRAAQEALWTVTSRVAGIAAYPAAGS
jgi:NAD(P)-dependent dehydrogenase (short-subunit alcohol dehydrogenase family)